MLKISRSTIAIPLCVSGIAICAGADTALAQQAQQPVDLRVARFWRGEGRTLLEGLVGMPVARANRTLELTVRDTAGKVLHTGSMTDSVTAKSAALAAVQAQTTNMFELVLNSGTYDVAVVAQEGAKRDSSHERVTAFPSAPVISDVVVSAHMRVLGESEEPTAVEMKRGRYAIERGTRVTILPSSGRLWYYLELYRQGNDSIAALEFQVARKGKDPALVQVTRNVAVGARGTVDGAAMMVAGLPPGDYTLRVKAKAGDREDQREADFTMASFESTEPVAPVSGSASESNLFDQYFAPAVRSDEQINQMVEALVVAPPAQAVANETLRMPTDAQRRFLSRYWSRVPDPVPATAGKHEFVDEFSQRVVHVERAYKERGRAGVRTDRGRIYLKFGPPDAAQQLPLGASNAVELWKYTRNRQVKYAFMDLTGFSEYTLIYTTDPQERTFPDWAERVADAEVVRMILNY